MKAGIHCVKPEYIAAFLTENPPPSPDVYHIPEIQSLSHRSAHWISGHRAPYWHKIMGVNYATGSFIYKVEVHTRALYMPA